MTRATLRKHVSRRFRFGLSSLLFLVFVSAVLIKLWTAYSPMLAPAPPKHDPSDFKGGYVQGVAEADAEWRDGHPTNYEWGLIIGYTEEDLEIGLPNKYIARTLDHYGVGRVAGHNQRIRDYLSKNESP